MRVEESSSWEGCWPRADPTDKMECHPKAPELQKAAKDPVKVKRVWAVVVPTAEVVSSSLVERHLEVKEEYEVRTSWSWRWRNWATFKRPTESRSILNMLNRLLSCWVRTMRKPDGTCVWYMQRHHGFGEELHKPTKEEIDESDKEAAERDERR